MTKHCGPSGGKGNTHLTTIQTVHVDFLETHESFKVLQARKERSKSNEIRTESPCTNKHFRFFVASYIWTHVAPLTYDILICLKKCLNKLDPRASLLQYLDMARAPCSTWQALWVPRSYSAISPVLEINFLQWSFCYEKYAPTHFVPAAVSK